MKRFFYDLHIHSCLSPCSDDDMTPYNIVNMAMLNGLDIIALTDHNSCKNCPAAVKAAEHTDITLICGMELCTLEEIHMICLFESLEGAMAFDAFIEPLIPDIPSNPQFFGNQIILGEEDKIIGSYDKLLATAANISIEELPDAVKRFGGICFPAHIDKSSYSIISSLGTIPDEFDFKAVEISSHGNIAKFKQDYPFLGNIPLLFSSDAHYLEDIHQQCAWLSLPAPDSNEVLKALSGKCNGFGRG